MKEGKSIMKNVRMMLLIALAIMIFAAAPAAAAPMCANNTTLAALMAGSPCQVGSDVFSTWGLASTASGGPAIAASDINVQFSVVGLNTVVQFSTGWATNGVGFKDTLISYRADAADNLTSILGLGLFFNGSYTGNGHTNVVEQYCPGGMLSSCPTVTGQLNVTNPPPNFSATTMFVAGAQFVFVSKDIYVGGDSLPATAFTSQVENILINGPVAPVPEASTFLMIGFGLLSAGVFKGKAFRLQSAGFRQNFGGEAEA